MLVISFNREDLYPWCKKVPLKMLNINDHIDMDRLRKEGKIKSYDIAKATVVTFEDSDGNSKILRDRKL